MMKDSLGFVFVVEQGDLEDKGLLLAESIRQFSGKYRNAPIWAVQPRRGMRISQQTLEKFSEFNVVYVFADLNRIWREHAFSNKLYAMAFLEPLVCFQVETLCFLDSDSLVLNEPEELVLPQEKDIAVRPVHVHRGNGTGWAVEESSNPFWEFMLEIAGTNRSQLWQIETRVDQKILWAYFNAGIMAVRPQRGIFQKIIQNLALLKQDTRFKAYVEKHYSYFFYLDQFVMTATIIAEIPRKKILLLSDRYNYPLNLHTEIPQQKQASSLDELTHIHYHEAFYDTDWMRHIGICSELQEWLLVRLPLSRQPALPTAVKLLTEHDISTKDLLMQIARRTKHGILKRLTAA